MAVSRKKSFKKNEIRLYPSNLNSLLDASVGKSDQAISDMPEVHSACVEAKYRLYGESQQFAVFNVTKDSETRENENYLPYIGDVINKAKESKDFKSKILLIPMRQCRGFMKLPIFTPFQREHIVFVEVDLFSSWINIHDSQSKGRYHLYPDKIKDIAKKCRLNYKANYYNAYNKQKDEVLCGYYVHQYILARLAGRGYEDVKFTWSKDEEGYKQFTLSHGQVKSMYSSRSDYLKKYNALPGEEYAETPLLMEFSESESESESEKTNGHKPGESP